MTDTLQLEDAVQLRHLHDAPKLLIEWSPRWQEFVTSIRPAFARSGARLAGEAPHGIFPYRGTLAARRCWKPFLVFVVIVLPREIDKLRPYAAPKVRPYEVIYYSGDELPRTEDLGGAQAGATGRAGGHEAHHRTQTIHVARGRSLAPKVVDAPNLKLPSTAGAVANLLAFKATSPGPPPSEGLHSSQVAPSLPINVIAPAPVRRDSRSVPRRAHPRFCRSARSECFFRQVSIRSSSECGGRAARAQRPLRAHFVRARARSEHHRPALPMFPRNARWLHLP